MANLNNTATQDPMALANLNAPPPAVTNTTIVGNDYVAQTPPGSNPAGTVTTPPTVGYTPPPVTQVPPSNTSGKTVQGYLDDLLSQDSAFMRNASQQGMNIAASRGLRNSSIAAGNAQQAAIEGSMPVLNNIMNLNNQREQQAFTGEQNQFDRNLTVEQQNANMALQTQQQNAQQAYQSEQAALDRTQTVNNKVLDAELASDAASKDFQFKQWLQDAGVKQQDWLNSQQYDREWTGALSQMQLKTASDLFQQILSAAVNDPETFPADVAAGMQNFFMGNWTAMMNKYMPSTVRS